MISLQQIRGARAMLGMTQAALAERAKLSATAINNIERGLSDPRVSSLAAIQHALEKAGVEFIPENGGGAGCAAPEISCFPNGDVRMAPSKLRSDAADSDAGDFIDVPEAEHTADVQALIQRLKRAILQADVLCMPDVRRLLEQAVHAAEDHSKTNAVIAGEPGAVKSIGQHEPESTI